ncbi:MAG TPA: hypothetical protein VF649_02460 [Sphingomonas sp.]|jgi:hypothetical protein|uniref:hypothetical protein n=1 Tax=Sphingomonas sp. TaxID=28214 RepID=UPI002ED82D02
MSDHKTDGRVYGGPDAADKQGAQPEGLRGERVDAATSRPELRHAGAGLAGGAVIEEMSGVAYVEVIGTAGRGPEPVVDNAVPAERPRSHPMLLLAVFATGLWLGSRRRSRPAVAMIVEQRGAPPAFATMITDPANFDQTRDAGPDHMRDAGRARWDVVDEGSDESFPASDPPSYSRPER